jgi:glycosyltransferase involved in cell wall biosynthesis
VLRPLVDSPDQRRRIGDASRAYVEEVHDLRRMTDRLLDLYADLR